MANCFYDLIDRNNKVNYNDLKKYVSRIAMADFLADVGMPFLVGKALFEGSMSKQDDGQNTNTMKFSLAGDNSKTVLKTDQAPGSSAISRAVYFVRKCIHSSEDRRHVFSVGRASVNDVTIADYVISRHHAAIHTAAGKFFIEDLGSTNGVKINGKKITRGAKVMLPLGAEISFGRYCFMFASPGDLFTKVRSSI